MNVKGTPSPAYAPTRVLEPFEILEIPLHASYEGAELPIVANLAASSEPTVVEFAVADHLHVGRIGAAPHSEGEVVTAA